MPNPRRRPGQLGDLPLTQRLDRAPGPLHDPGTGLIPEWVNNYTATLFPFVIGLASQIIIPSNPLRTYVLIQNKDAVNDMFINFGNDATTFNGIIIIPRGNYELIGGANGGPFCPSDSVHVLGAAAGMNGVIVEGVLPPVMPYK
jgi:hypothetical protein